MSRKQVGTHGLEINLDDFFPTGFIIELGNGEYFKGWKNRRIQYGILAGAKHFPSIKAAEDYIYHALYYIGLDPYICRIGWILTDIQNDEEDYTRNIREAQWFWSYGEVSLFQEQHSLQDTTMIEYHIERIKKVVIAAA